MLLSGACQGAWIHWRFWCFTAPNMLFVAYKYKYTAYREGKNPAHSPHRNEKECYNRDKWCGWFVTLTALRCTCKYDMIEPEKDWLIINGLQKGKKKKCKKSFNILSPFASLSGCEAAEIPSHISLRSFLSMLAQWFIFQPVRSVLIILLLVFSCYCWVICSISFTLIIYLVAVLECFKSWFNHLRHFSNVFMKTAVWIKLIIIIIITFTPFCVLSISPLVDVLWYLN